MSTLRWGLSAVVAFDLASFVWFVTTARDRAHDLDVDVVTGMATSLPATLAVASMGLIGIASFARRANVAGGAAALGALALLSHGHSALVGSPWRHLYYGGLCLLGWLVGSAFARRAGEPRDESYPRAAATALLGAAYVNAGISKLAYGGLEWAQGATLRYIVVSQDGMVGDGLLPGLRHAVVDQPAFAGVLGALTVLFELGAVLFIAGPRARAVVALGLLGMHAFIFALTGIAYVEAAVLLVLFGLPIVREDAARELGPSTRTVAMGASLLAVLSAAFVVREVVTARSPDARRDTSVASVPRSSLGPFRLGDTLAGLTIVELGAGADSAQVFLERDAQRVGFDLTCRPTDETGPFDRAPLHVFYRRTDLSFTELEPVGNAVRDAVTSESDDPCADLSRWLGPTGDR